MRTRLVHRSLDELRHARRSSCGVKVNHVLVAGAVNDVRLFELVRYAFVEGQVCEQSTVLSAVPWIRRTGALTRRMHLMLGGSQRAYTQTGEQQPPTEQHPVDGGIKKRSPERIGLCSTMPATRQ